QGWCIGRAESSTLTTPGSSFDSFPSSQSDGGPFVNDRWPLWMFKADGVYLHVGFFIHGVF
ncbi:MAG: hypothetical protein ACI9DF_003176, partial [Verrucomicrobiales bacterium]